MTDSSDDKLEYLTKDLLQPLVDRSWRPSPQQSPGEQNDDDSNHLFMSEPSMSEADSSELPSNLLSPAESFGEDDDDNIDDFEISEDGGDGGGYLVMPPPPPPPRLLNTAQYPHSPGNTSLSSWESPHLATRQVQVQFSPDRPEDSKRRAQRSVSSGERHLFMPSQAAGPNVPDFRNVGYATKLPAVAGGRGFSTQGLDRVLGPGSDHQRSSDSSFVSDGQRRRLEDFLHELRVSSEGQVQETAGTDAHTSFESEYVPPTEKSQPNLNDVLRKTSGGGGADKPRPERLSSVDTALMQNTSVHSTPTSSRPGPSNAPDIPADDTVVMTLSASEDEGTKETTTTGEASRPLDWEQQNSADDEKTTQQNDRPRRLRSKQMNGGHRRQRSGDAAAATLLTGTTDWKGMDKDRIPMPPVPGGQDDDEDDEDSRAQKTGKDKGETKHHSPPFRNKPGASARAMEVAQFSKFAIGSPGKNTPQVYVNRQTRRSRREFRSRQRRSDSNVNEPVSWSKDSSNTFPSNTYPNVGPPPLGQSSSEKPPLSPKRDTSIPLLPRDPELGHTMNEDGLSSSYSGSHDWSFSERPTHRRTQSSQYGRVGSLAQARSLSERHISFQRSQMTPNSHQTISPQLSWYSGHQPEPYPNPHEHWGRSAGSVSSGESSFSWLSSGQFQGTRLKYREAPDAELSPSFWLPPQQRRDSSSREGRGDGERDDRVSDGSDSSSYDEEHLSMRNLGDPRRRNASLLRHHSPFANIGKSTGKVDRRRFMPQTTVILDDAGGNKYPTYICPNCKTVQREFFTVSDAPRQFESASFYVALYFGIYVVAALYIFGLQEGWPALDCIYFAVITLTTAGLGDLVPTSDGSKILCSVFIYFGVACIGLLLGSYIAGMLDESSRREQSVNRIDSCPNCARIKTLDERKEKMKRREETGSGIPRFGGGDFPHSFSERSTDTDPFMIERSPKKFKRANGAPSRDDFTQSERIPSYSATQNSPMMGSPLTAQILGRQSHTRHASFDLNSQPLSLTFGANGRKFSADLPTTVEEGADATDTDAPPPPPPDYQIESTRSDYGETDDDGSTESDESTSSSSLDESTEDGDKLSQVKRNGKYVFLTLKEALVNSMVIIAFGCLGFYFIEGFSIIDSWYFTTVLLTTVGYGDIVPVTRGGKLFATVYILVAGTILLNNMSMISMIPLELRKRRIEKAVLTQFGDQLDDAALRELATGPLIQRLNLSAQRPGGLDECTREMFALAMLVRLGKVTEQDLKSTFAAFRRLDVNNDGVLNSKSIIAGMIQRRRNNANFSQNQQQSIQSPPRQEMQPQPTPPPYWPGNNFYYYGSSSNLPASYHYSPIGPQMNNGIMATPNEQSYLMNDNESYGAYNVPMSVNDSSTRSY